MRLILLGPPGSGKGTQAKLLSSRLGLTHISTGDILREADRLATPEGLKARPYMQAGQLVPDEIVNEIVASRFRRDDRPECFVMDGYPRTLPQAASFEAVLKQQHLDLDSVIYFNIDDEVIVQRLGGRLTCSKCGATYQVPNKPPKVPNVCDVCKSPLIQREDDKPETIRHRLKVYHDQTEELIAHYRDAGLLRELKAAQGDVEAIHNEIRALLQKAKPPA
jgi:adenylate kinase